MRVLALDTTTRSGSVALVENGRVVDERRGDGTRTHAERLPREALDLVSAHALAPRDLDLFAVASGPGSFTGLRIGIATLQGLAFVTGRPMIGISLLDALAHAAAVELPAGALVGAWVDAHRYEVFAALYRVGNGAPFTPERVEPLEPPSVGHPAAILERWRDAGLPETFIGDGAALYAELIEDGAGAAAVYDAPLLAGMVGQLGAVRAALGEAGSPAAIRPLYVRRPDAELERERRR